MPEEWDDRDGAKISFIDIYSYTTIQIFTNSLNLTDFDFALDNDKCVNV